jgi:hypothetical protein
MKQYLEKAVREKYSDGPVQKGRWESDDVKPVSDDPKDRGLYVVRTYDEFFGPDFEKSKNGTSSVK